jgi:subtilisin family serine protease
VEKLYGVLAAGKALEVTSGEAFVRFPASVSGDARKAALSVAGAEIIGDLPVPGWVHVRLPEGMSVSAGLSALKNLPGVEAVEPNRAYRALRTPNDPRYSSQYHFENIHAPTAWEYETGSSSMVTIAVLDAGIDGAHPDLSGKLVGTSQKWSATTQVQSSNQPPTPACNHATRVAGTAAAVTNNGTGVAGVSWGARLISLKVFNDADCNMDCSDAGGSGCATTDATIMAALNYTTTTLIPSGVGRLVVNMSIGGTGACAPVLSAITSDLAANHDVVLVAAAGNDAGDVNSPGNCPGVIPVAATDSGNNVANFSSRGPALAANGLAAPGVGICTTDVSSAYTCSATGTSFSAPIVSGIAALILSKKMGAAFSASQVKDTLRSSAGSVGTAAVGPASLQSNTVGAGLADAFRAVRLTVDGSLTAFAGEEKAIAFPNPFRLYEHPSATITVPRGIEGSGLNIKLYTMDGQLVRDLGAKTTWDGKNDAGNAVASGTYIFLVKTGAGSTRGRIAVLH